MLQGVCESPVTKPTVSWCLHKTFMFLLRSTFTIHDMNQDIAPTLLDHSLLVEHLPAPRLSLRVGLVTETYPPEINGVALTLKRLVQGLQARGHHVQLVRPRQAPDDGPYSTGLELEQMLVRGLPIPNYPHLRMGLPAKRALVHQWTLQRPDVVHIATEGPLGWSALKAARKLGLPVSTDFRTNFDAYSRFYGIGWLQKPIAAYLRKFHNLAQCTTVPTEALRSTLAANRFERLHVVARGVDVANFNPAHRDELLRADWGASKHDTVAMYVGRIAPEKNLGLLARAFNAMKAANPAIKLVVVGDGPARNEFQAQCPDALLVGSQSGHALARHYASADCFVFSSLTETYGNVTPEALASGLAVLAYNHAAAGELILHGKNGLLAPAGHEEGFIHLAQSLASRPELVSQLRQQAPESVAGRDWSDIVTQVEGIWRELLLRQVGAYQGALLRAQAQVV